MTWSPDPLAKLDELSAEERVVTIGTFDGVHRGHQALVGAAAERAAELGLPLTVVTFDPPPVAVLRSEQFNGSVVPSDRKFELLNQAGADQVLVLPFTDTLAATSAGDFIDALASRARVRELFVGEAFALGRNREGTVDVLKALGAEHGVRVVALQRVERDGAVVSSSSIRRAILAGDVSTAHDLLGRAFRIEGEVIHGAHVGRTIGYPTANVLPPEGQVQLADGIYASVALLPEALQPLSAMTYIGTRPALNTGRRLIETHILDFDGDLYGQRITVDFVERLRGDADFPSLEALVAQLQRDEQQTRHILGAPARPTRLVT